MIGEQIVIRLGDGRRVVATVCDVFQSTSGIKVRATSGDLLLTASAQDIEGYEEPEIVGRFE